MDAEFLCEFGHGDACGDEHGTQFVGCAVFGHFDFASACVFWLHGGLVRGGFLDSCFFGVEVVWKSALSVMLGNIWERGFVWRG